MENQHKIIKGYRDLNQSEIDLMNEVKFLAKDVGELIERFKFMHTPMNNDDEASVDPRWLAIAQTDLQKGFMSLVRSIAKPTTF